MIELKVKYMDNTLDTLRQIKDGNWIDVRSSEEIHLKKGEFTIIPLGFAMEIPKGYEAHLVPRSSTFKNWGIIQTNGMGIIDETYCGDNDEWGMPVYATRDTVIGRNDRVAQFRIVKRMEKVKLKEVGTLGNKDRGGFGSTGKANYVGLSSSVENSSFAYVMSNTMNKFNKKH